VVIAPPAADAQHPAFSNLFVQTEILRDRRAILCTRRPRSLGEQAPWMLHLMVVHGAETGEASYETDRSALCRPGRNLSDPLAMGAIRAAFGERGVGAGSDRCHSLSHGARSGAVRRPSISFRDRETRDLAVSLVEKYQDRHLADRVFELAWTHSQVVLQQLNATEADAQLYARLASSVIYANASLRASAEVC
jgi:cyclic beta-1,2-glucan synthetase